MLAQHEIVHLCEQVAKKYNAFVESTGLHGDVKIYGADVVVPAEVIVRNSAKQLKDALNELTGRCNSSAVKAAEDIGIHL